MASPPSPSPSPSVADLNGKNDQSATGNGQGHAPETTKAAPQASRAEPALTAPSSSKPVESKIVQASSKPSPQPSSAAPKGPAAKLETRPQDIQGTPATSQSAQSAPPAPPAQAPAPHTSSASKAKTTAKALLKGARLKSAAPASALPKLDAPPPASDGKQAEDASEKPAKPSKQAKKEQTEAAKIQAKQPQAPTLREITKASDSQTPSVVIVAVHDPGLVLDTAWAYVPDKPPAKRQTALSRPSPADGKQGAKSPVDVTQTPTRTAAPRNLQAGLEALNNDYKNREEREKSDRSWVETWANGADTSEFTEITEGQRQPHHNTPHDEPRTEKHPALLGIENSGAGESGRRPSMRRGSQFPVMEPKPIVDEDFNSHPSSRPSSKSGSKPRSDKEKVVKAVKQANWLTHQTMLSSELDQARILVFEYASFRPPPPKKDSSPEAEREKHLESTAETLLTNLKKKKLVGGYDDPVPVVFIASGFGCMVIQRLITLVGKNGERSNDLGSIASILLLDAPRVVKEPEKPTEKPKSGSKPAKATAATATTTSQSPANIESKLIDINGLWTRFQERIKDGKICTVWFYAQAQNAPLPSKDPEADVDFVKWEAAPATVNAPKQPIQRFKGPQDRNYLLLVNQLKRCLLFWASAEKDRLKHLEAMIDWGHDLGLTDHHQRCCLHRAAEYVNDGAMYRLINARPDLASDRDQDGCTPLHTIVKTAVNRDLDEDDKIPVQGIIEKLRIVLLENQQNDDELKDKAGKVPGDYAEGDSYQWIRNRCEYRVLLHGTRAAKPESIKDPMPPLSEPAKEACKRLKATLAQFYIAKDLSSDYLDPQRPHVHTALYNESYGIDELFRRNLRHDEEMQPTCRWIHLPANNEKWLHDLFAYQFRRIDKSTRDRRHLGSAPFDRHIVPDAFRYKQVYDPLDKSEILQQSNTKKTVTALFIPVFGFEKHKNRKKLSKHMKDPSHPGSEETSLLLKAYFNDSLPLHCRRTLDQFTYHMLEDTERRDTSQVIFRWASRERKRAEKTGALLKKHFWSNGRPVTREDYPLLMIDQLWLWILEDEQTVVTSLPNIWDQTEDYNLERYLRQHVLSENDERQLINGPLDLANSIIRGSIDFLRRPGPLGITMYESFQSSITLIAEVQAQKFDDFKALVRKLNAGELDKKSRAKLTNDLFQLTTETQLLAEIIDIQDELKTSHEVMNKQREALEKFLRLLPSDQGQDKFGDDFTTPESSIQGFSSDENLNGLASPGFQARSETLQSALRRVGTARKGKGTVQFSDQGLSEPKTDNRSKPWLQAKENLLLVDRNIATIKEMIAYAKKIQGEINGLLSHRQKQANIWEARFAREGSEYTQRQSKITLVFTIVTVFFLPLSFMSSIFAIQIDAFPHNEETGEVSWPLGRVMSLLFGISFGIIFFVAFLGFYINEISNKFSKHLLPKLRSRLGTEEQEGRDSYLDFDDGESRTGSAASDEDQDTNSDVVQNQSIDTATSKPSTYARLFGIWSFHAKIPGLRRLWQYYEDTSGRKKKGLDSDSDSDNDMASQSTWGSIGQRFGKRKRDYPLDRFMRPLRKLLPWSKKKETDASPVEDDYSRPSSGMRVGDDTGTGEEGWDLTPGQIRRRQTHSSHSRGGSYPVGFSFPQWQETPDIPEKQEWPLPLGPDEDGATGARTGDNDTRSPEEGLSRREIGMIPRITALLDPDKTRHSEKQDLEGRLAD